MHFGLSSKLGVAGNNIEMNGRNIWDLETARDTLVNACNKKNNIEPVLVIQSLVHLERSLMKRNNSNTSDFLDRKVNLSSLNGAWRLVFTTGTTDLRKRFGSINYFPVKAIQTFDTEKLLISNGIYFGETSIVRFFGTFSWSSKLNKMEFDFNSMRLFGFLINLPIQKEPKKKAGGRVAPFFKWIYVDDQIAAARGGGGGLAVWKRETQ